MVEVIYFKTVIILYADDTVIFYSKEEEFQSLLNAFSDYCSLWKLDINFSKAKVMVIGDKINRNRNIKTRVDSFKIDNYFKYLGVVFSQYRHLDMPIECQWKLWVLY